MISFTLICTAITVCLTLMTKMLIDVNFYGNEKTDFQIKTEIFTRFFYSGVFRELLVILYFRDEILIDFRTQCVNNDAHMWEGELLLMTF